MGDAEASREVSRILRAAGEGRAVDLETLFPLIYDQFRALAGRLMADERRGRTLQPTALVHEAYLRLLGRDDPGHAPTIDLEIASSLAGLGTALLRQGKLPEAEIVVRESLDIRSRLIPDHFLRYNAMGLLGEILVEQGRLEEAEPLVLGGDEGMAPGSPWKEEAGKRVHRLREAQGK